MSINTVLMQEISLEKKCLRSNILNNVQMALVCVSSVLLLYAQKIFACKIQPEATYHAKILTSSTSFNTNSHFYHCPYLESASSLPSGLVH